MKKKLNVNGATYAVEIHQRSSSLPSLLMLHGFMGDSRAFHHLLEGLSKSCNPITVDLLGHGQSDKIYTETRYNEEAQIADITALVQQLELARVFLYGYSMGGRLALKAALKFPELWGGLLLESTTYGLTDEKKRADRRRVDAQRAEKISIDYKTFLAQWKELALFNSPVRVDKQLAANYNHIHLSQDSHAMAASIVGFGTGSMAPVRTELHGFTKPVMVIAGTEDQKYINLSKSLVSYFDKAHLCHITAGHRVHLDNPQELVQEINFFLDQNSLL